MAKYICDFSEVNRIGSELCALAKDLKTDVEDFNTKIQSDLSGWTGTASGNFSGQCSAQVAIATANAEMAQELGDFIKSAASSIQEVEDQLGSMSI